MKEIEETQQMKRYTILLNQKSPYCQNDYIAEGKVQIQCNSYQISNGILHRNRIKKFKFVWKHKIPEYPKQS